VKRARLLSLVAVADTDVDDADPNVLALIKAATGNVSLSSMLTEISRLEAVWAIGLPAGLFADVAPKVLAVWRARAALESPSHLRSHSVEVTLTLLAALVHCRGWEIADALVTLLLRTVHAIEARADRRVTKQLVAEVRRVQGKENLLFPGGGGGHGPPGRHGAAGGVPGRRGGRPAQPGGRVQGVGVDVPALED
jgi:hypothetical protein